MIKNFFKKIIHILNISLIILTIVLWIIAIVKPELFHRFIEWMRKIIYTLWVWNYLVAFVSAFIESFPLLWVVVPWQNIMLIVWWFFGPKNIYLMITIAVIGSLLWNYFWYLLGKYYWDDFFRKYWDWMGIWETELKYMKKWIKKHWWWMIVVGKFHNVSRCFVPFIAWSMGMKNKSFAIYNVIGSMLRAITIILLWVVFVEYYKIILKYAPYVILGLIIFISIYIYSFKKEEFKKYLKEKEAEIEKKYNN